MTEQNFFPLSKALKSSVLDIYNEKVGTITDIYFSANYYHRLLYLVISVGGFSVVGNDKYVAVPWPMVTCNPVTKMMKLKVHKDKILQSPAIGKENLHKPDEKLLEEVFRYYGHPDQWEGRNSAEDNITYEEKRGEIHQAYEGSVKATENVPDANTEEEVNYDKMKGIE